ncbi:MAG: nucleotidyltransferase domain-containing protein [Sedimentisphaerales bacterium]|nr:nucleotidyltransferase domain-containing protein [Sedimentisphaerales bacterium]MBN2842259.1 nucleotidyltransferase domain-containing protein [Sedimentisphaerales bacterium]
MRQGDERFGLAPDVIEQINAVFARYSQIEKVVIYGSRAKGNFKKGSDIDLTMFGSDLSYQFQADLLDELDELYLPYQIDLSVFDKLENVNLKEHIERVGKVFYSR